MTATLMHSVYVYEREPGGMPTGRWEHTLEREWLKKKKEAVAVAEEKKTEREIKSKQKNKWWHYLKKNTSLPGLSI